IAGRMRACMNSIRDGLDSDVLILPWESKAAYKAHLKVWVGRLKPQTEREMEWTQEAANQAWKIRRVDRAERNALERLRLERSQAESRAELQTVEVKALGARLLEDPVGVVTQLRQSTIGCQYLLAQWNKLAWSLKLCECLWRSDRP